MSKRTRNRRLASIKSFYNFLKENGHVKDNPADRIRLERLSDNEKQVEPLDERVTINLLSITKTDTMTGKRSYAILDLLLGTVIRGEELVELNIKDVHIIEKRTSSIVVRKAKGDKTRTIPLARPQKESLINWLKVREAYAKEIKSQAIFITRLGARLTGESVRQLVKAKLLTWPKIVFLLTNFSYITAMKTNDGRTFK